MPAPHQLSISVQPIQATGLSATLGRIRTFRNLQRRLLQAWPDLSLAQFLGIMAAVGFAAFMLFASVGSLWVATGIGAAAAYIPLMLLNAKRGRRQRQLSVQLPEALDFLSRVLRAGHSFSTGLQMMGDELPQPLAAEFRRAFSQHSLGQPLEDALKDMASRIESTDFAFFVTAVLIQRQTGGDLSEVLNNISGMVRQRIRLQQSVKAKTSEGRFTGYILVAFPAVMFLITYVLSPKTMDTMIHDSTGLTLLGIAFGLQMMGLWAIRKITAVKV
jgi:tight adherence protein B